MTDREQNPAAALGRLMSWIGSIWLVFSVLWGLGALQALGLSGSIASGIGSTIFPALILLGVGRAVRRRARSVEDPVQPDVSREPVRTPPILPRTDTSYEPPRPTAPTTPKSPRPVAAAERAPDKPIEVVAGPGHETATPTEWDPAPGSSGPHKTSQELIEEARRRWGTRP